MGIFDGLGMSPALSLFGSAAPGYYGQQAMSPEQQVRFGAMLAQQQAPRHFTTPMGFPPPQSEPAPRRPRKAVTCIDVATKHISGAVDAVDDAMQAVKDAQERG